jgi:hypothetical protein
VITLTLGESYTSSTDLELYLDASLDTPINLDVSTEIIQITSAWEGEELDKAGAEILPSQ